MFGLRRSRTFGRSAEIRCEVLATTRTDNVSAVVELIQSRLAGVL